MHSLALTERGEVLVFGSNAHGQLGLGDVDESMNAEPVPQLDGAKVKRIAAGPFSSMVETEDRRVLAC